MKTALITGASGFVGHHVIEHLLVNTDWKIIGIDSFRHRGDSMRLRHLKDSPRFTVFTHDLATPFSDRMIHKMGKVDYILSIASDSHVERSIDDPVPFVLNNISIALQIGELARKMKPEKVLCMSTDEAFGPSVNGHAHGEWEPSKPSNPYAASKCAQDDIMFSYWRCYGVPVIRTRTMNIFGERQDTEKYLPMLIQKISRGETVCIHGKPGDIGTRMYLHARNLADAWLFLLRNREPTVYVDNHHIEQQFDAFNISGVAEVNNLELAQMVAGILGKELKYELKDFHNARPGHDRAYRLNSQKILELGWTAPVPFEESLKHVVEWTMENKEWTL